MKDQDIKRNIVDIARKHGLSLVVQFGSSLEKDGLKHSESDIDIAFLPESRDFTLKQLINLQYDLAVMFGVFEDKIDLVNLASCNSLIAYHSAMEGQVLFDSDGHQFNRFYVRAVKQKIDEEDIFHLKRQILSQRIGVK